MQCSLMIDLIHLLTVAKQYLIYLIIDAIQLGIRNKLRIKLKSWICKIQQQARNRTTMVFTNENFAKAHLSQ